MDILSDLLGGGQDRPPAPEVATAADLEEYNHDWLKANGPIEAQAPESSDTTVQLPYARQLNENVQTKAQYPWLYEPERGVRWDFDPIELRNIAQGDTWVGMMVQSITKEIAETPWTIVKSEGGLLDSNTRKRLQTHPEKRTPIAKADTVEGELPDRTAEEIARLLMDPNPDHTWHDWVEMAMGDLLEVGSAATVKSFRRSAYDGEGQDATLTADADMVRPQALMPTAPEVWTKGYQGRTGILDAYYQFDRERSPGSGNSAGGTTGTRGYQTAIEFDTAEMMWTDMTPRTNRRYGMPPTLLVKEFIQSMDLAVTQEQEYMSRGSVPSGAMIFENYDREELKEWKQENEENIKGKPWKMLTIAGKGEGVSFEPFSFNFKEMQYTERMQWYARVIASVFQVPTAVVGIEPEKVNYNTFQGERENFEENTLGPYLQKLERYVNDSLIEPHWGDGYHFEFKPGVSESTRRAISERVRAEWNANLVKRSTALRELGKEIPDDAEDGYKADVVDDGGDGGPFDNVEGLEQSADTSELAKAEYEVGEETIEIDPPEYMVAAAEAGQAARDEYDELEDCGTGKGNDRANQIIDDEVGPDVVDEIAAYLTSHEEDVSGLDGNYSDWGRDEWTDGCGTVQYALWGGTGDGRALEWAQEKSDEVAEARGEEPTYKLLTDPAGGSGNANSAVRKDEPLRETDEWYQFSVQPAMVDELQADIADDVREVFDRVLSDDKVMDIIDRLAADETEKTLGALGRRLKEIFEESDVVARIEAAIQDHTTEAATATLSDALEVAPEDERPEVDIARIREQLSDRSVEFAHSFANEMRDDIREIVGDGWAEGKDTRTIAQDIGESMDINEGWTGAERIARQELQIATGEARSEVANELNKVEVWQTSGDDRVRPTHEEMNGTWAFPGDEWVVDYSEEGRGVQKESVPGDSEAGIGCRCTVLLRDRDTVDSGDYAGDNTLN